MIVEGAQLLCAVAHLRGFEAPYRLTHKNHPATKWTAKSSANWNWLCEHGIALSKEYTYRYGKTHKSQAIIQSLKDRSQEIWGESLPYTEHTDFALCMPDEYKVDDPVQSYRNYYIGAKKDIAKWTVRSCPDWWPL